MSRYLHELSIQNQKKIASPYFSSFILVLGLIIIAVIIGFVVIYQKQIFQDFQQNFDQVPDPIVSPGPDWPIPLNLNQNNVYDYCNQKKKQQKQNNQLIQQQILSDSASSLDMNS